MRFPFTLWLLLAALAVPGRAADRGWINLSQDPHLAAWQKPTGQWFLTDKVEVDPNNPRRLKAKPGQGAILVNGPTGRTPDIHTKASFKDVEVHTEFLIPKGSNSGIKLEGWYEIQIYDSYGVKKLSGSDCGGIYPRAEMEPVYHHIDDGVPPRVNASRRPGEWQTLDIIFQAPRFDEDGKKIANARFVKVVLNGQVVQDNVEVKTPTGNNWRNQEIPTGPVLLQGDHGPVAFRNLRIRPYRGEDKKK